MLSFTATSGVRVFAGDIENGTCEGINIATGTSGTDCAKDTNGDDPGTAFGDIIKNVINILSILVGAVSVIMLIIGGFRYIISNGDANSTKGAKDTILYALIGLIIVLFAQVIVRFIWTNASTATAPAASATAFISWSSSSV
jgi:hypothetical protein